MMFSFEERILHDGHLEWITLHWKERRVVARLTVFLEPGKNAVDCELIWTGVENMSLPHHEPWGPSSFINSNGVDGSRYWVEMQSGDMIEIWADGVELNRIESKGEETP